MNMLVTFIFVLTALAHAHGQSPENFISIDCGLAENADYTDNKTGINYVSDATLVNTGVSHNISSEYNRETLERQFSNLRSFPEGIRNCYTLKPSKGDGKFLIRARFMYGNYDGQNMAPSFKLMLEADEWDSVRFEDAYTIITKEIIHISKRKYIDVCLVNTGFGTPFISALELRPVKNSTYETKSGSLLLFERWDVGTTNNETFRYKDDMFDRIWWPYSSERWAPISTSKSVGSDDKLGYNLPSNVMRTGAIPVDPNYSLGLLWKPEDPTSKYYLYLHFAEIEPERTNRTREMNIYVNEKLWYGPFSPQYLSAETVFSTSPIQGEQNIISLEKTENSTLPPILNAVEIYQAKDFSQLLTNQQDVDTIMRIKSKYEVERNWQGDPCAPRVYLWQGLDCSYDDDQSPRIISLNLSSSGLRGEIIPFIFRLTSIETLDLSNNNLTGPVPEFLSELQFLRVLNLSGNNLHGSLPDGLIERVKNGSLSLSVDGNPKLCHLAPCKKSNKKFIFPVVASSVVSISVLVAALTILWNLRKRKQAGKKKGSLELKSRKFSYSDVLRITNNFERVLGQGGFGRVYHGHLDDTQVAVKMLSPSSVQGYKQFRAEVELRMRAHHKNLTILVGYCDEGTNIGLIYEFMANGNLQAHLIEDEAEILSWEGRLRIATEAAQGLEYLHNGCKPPIIHRDVKPANILLNERFQAKLADFGLSRIFPIEGGTHVSTTVVGTPGYLDPEYYISNRLTEKSDVYSFGVVLLELITGQPVIQKTHERTHIGQWVSFMLAKGDIKNIVDQRLQGDFDTNTVWKTVELAMACVTLTSTKRPTMNQVVIELNDCLAMEIARKTTKAHGTAPNGSNNELMMDLDLQSHEALPLAR